MAAASPPLTLGEILDRTVQLYRRNFLLLAGIATPAAALTVLISGSVVLLFSHQLFSLGELGQSGKDTTQAASEAGMLIGLGMVVFVLIGLPVLLVVFSMCFSALNYASFHLNQGENVTIRESYKYSFAHFWRHVGILFLQSLFAGIVPYFVFGAIVMIGAVVAALVSRSGAGQSLAALFVVLLIVLILALVVACVLIWLRLSLAYPASVGENKKAWDALKRSNQLTNGSRGRIFVMFLLVWLLSIVLAAALAIPVDIVIALVMHNSLTNGHPPVLFFTVLQGANLLAGFLVRIFVMPIYAVALLLFYNDQRTRLEGYDIEQLMSRAGWGELPQSTPSSETTAVLTEASDPAAYSGSEAVYTPGPVESAPASLPSSEPHPEGTGA
jgi:hypothetical protein